MDTPKKKRGDRRDGTYLCDLDPLHGFTPYLMPNRADNEAFIQESIETAPLNAYLAKKTVECDPEFKYTYMHAIVAALVKTFALRPRMNRFVSGNRMYQRNVISATFVVKKAFSDDSAEFLEYMELSEDGNIDTLHQRIKNDVTGYRKKPDAVDNSTDKMGMLLKLPRFILKIIIGILFYLDRRGKVPYELIKEDPNYASIFVSNLGSIGLHAAYHHLNNWGTNSLFVVIGEKHMAPFFDETGKAEMREVIDLGITLDERIADGYYYSKTIKLMKYLLSHPDLLDTPAKEPVEYE